jgi:hypothetical protein
VVVHTTGPAQAGAISKPETAELAAKAQLAAAAQTTLRRGGGLEVEEVAITIDPVNPAAGVVTLAAN